MLYCVPAHPCGMLYKKKGGADMEERWYAAIDLKSFYASVECVERGLALRCFS